MDRKLVLAALFAASLSALPLRAQDAAPGRSKVRITGSGNSVVLERHPAPETSRRKSPPASEPAQGPIDSAAQMKASGASDAAVIAFLKSRDDLPAVIAADDVRRLRKAGAGQSVIGWLSRVAALDIGETGEGHEVAAYAEPAPAMDYGSQVYDAGYSVPYYYGGGYYPAGGYTPSRFHRFGHASHPIVRPAAGAHPIAHVPRPAPHVGRITGVPARRLFP
jgi:hypothetical protein